MNGENRPKYGHKYSHFGTVSIPFLDGGRIFNISLLLRRNKVDGKIYAFYDGKKESLTLELAQQLKEGSHDPYIDASGLHFTGYNRVNGNRRWR